MSVYMSGTCGSGVLSSAGDMLEMSVVRGVGGVCNMYMSLARGGVGGVGGERIGLGLNNSGGTWGKWDMRLCFGCGGVGGVGGQWVGGLCCVCVCCESGLFVLMAGPCICILC